MQFKDQRVIITGGTRGLGKVMALAFAEEGARVGVNYSADAESAKETEQALQKLQADYLLLQADISQSAEVDEMFQQVLSRWGHVDILINNAGIIRDKMLLFLNEKDWDRVLEVNLKGTYLCSRSILKSMISRRSGRIINITSPSALTGRAGQSNYAAAKGGIISFTKSLAKEVARLGITVNAVCPGVIKTPLTEGLDQKTKEDLLGMIPMGRFGDPRDIAHAVLFVASPKAGYMTGQVLVIDGGMT